jgi:hypothetical protein
MRGNPEWEVYRTAAHDAPATDGEDQRAQRRDQTATALAGTDCRPMAALSGPWPLPVLWPALKQPEARILQASPYPLVAQGASPPEPAPQIQLGQDDTPCEELDSACKSAPSTAGPQPVRQNPRQEPSAVVPLAGICAGGAEQSALLPRPR